MIVLLDKRAGVEHRSLLQALVDAKRARGALANDVELPLEGVLIEPVGRADEELLDARHALERGRPEIGAVRIGRHDTPAEEALPLRFDRLQERGLAVRALLVVGRQKDVADAVLARLGKVDAELLLGRATQELVWDSGEHPGAVAGVRLRTAGAAVVHVAEDAVGVLDDLVGRHALDLGNEADAARVLLVRGVVETVFFGESVLHVHVVMGVRINPLKKGTVPFWRVKGLGVRGRSGGGVCGGAYRMRARRGAGRFLPSRCGSTAPPWFRCWRPLPWTGCG